MKEVKSLKTYINAQLDIIVREGASNKTIVLLHGYRQTNSWIYKKLIDSIPQDFTVICPNAPYLVPRRNPNLMQKTYAWYFFNDNRTEYLVPIDDAVRIVGEAIEQYSPKDNEIYLVGFSQGGYLTPFIASNFKRTKKCILICARIRTEILKSQYPFQVDSIHGAKDILVNIDRSKKCYQEFISNGNVGSFYEIEDLDHDINKEVQKCFQSLIT